MHDNRQIDLSIGTLWIKLQAPSWYEQWDSRIVNQSCLVIVYLILGNTVPRGDRSCNAMHFNRFFRRIFIANIDVQESSNPRNLDAGRWHYHTTTEYQDSFRVSLIHAMHKHLVTPIGPASTESCLSTVTSILNQPKMNMVEYQRPSIKILTSCIWAELWIRQEISSWKIE